MITKIRYYDSKSEASDLIAILEDSGIICEAIHYDMSMEQWVVKWNVGYKHDFHKINQMTLDVAKLLKRKFGVDGYQYESSMNTLRECIITSLKANNENPAPHTTHINWHELGRKK